MDMSDGLTSTFEAIEAAQIGESMCVVDALTGRAVYIRRITEEQFEREYEPRKEGA